MAQPRAPRARLNPKLRIAVYRSGHRLGELADHSGFSAYTHLSAALNDRYVIRTPLLETRLRLVANVISYEGEIFVGGDVEQPVSRDAFDADHLPGPR